MPRRVVHLHWVPTGAVRAAVKIASAGAERVLMPSVWMRETLGLGEVLPNWTRDMGYRPGLAEQLRAARPKRIGFLGRMTTIKGIEVVAQALQQLGDGYQLIVWAALLGSAAPTTRGASVTPSIRSTLPPSSWVG